MINTPLSRDADAERAARSRGNLTSSGAGGNTPTRNVLCPSCRARTSTREMKGKVGSGAHCPGLPTVDYSTTSPGGIPTPRQIYHGLACIRRGELGSVCSAVSLHAGVRVSVRVRGWRGWCAWRAPSWHVRVVRAWVASTNAGGEGGRRARTRARVVRMQVAGEHWAGMRAGCEGVARMWIGYEDVDRLITYPDVDNLSGCR